jgi:hypothetical protein
VAGNLQSLSATIAGGTLQLAVVEADAKTLETSLDAVPGIGADAALRLSPDLRNRYQELATTRSQTAGLAAAWTAFTGRALDAADLTSLLTEHDTQTAAAARAGAAAHFPEALAALDTSDAVLVRSLALRDHLASTGTDVSTLTEWLTRDGVYDAALRTLYQSLVDAKGVVTAAVRAAFAAEQSARAQLPGDTKGLVVIMSDIARGGLNQAVIAIEEARGSLNAALEVQRGLQLGAGLPG